MPADFVSSSFARRSKTNFILGGGAVDRLFFCPNVSEVHRLIALVKNELKYKEEVHDCDDFSRHFKDRLLHRWAKEGNRFPLPIVEVYAALQFEDGTRVLHAFNAIVTDEGKVIYIEPQGPTAVSFRKTKILVIISAYI